MYLPFGAVLSVGDTDVFYSAPTQYSLEQNLCSGIERQDKARVIPPSMASAGKVCI